MILIFLALHIGWNKVGNADWCMVNIHDRILQCTYNTNIDCESYNYHKEKCISNTFK